MSLILKNFGNKNVATASDGQQSAPVAAAKAVPAPTPLETLADLLGKLENHPDYLMLRTGLGYIAQCLGLPPDKIQIASLQHIDFDFRFKQFFERHKLQLSPNSVKKYRDVPVTLLREAKKLGWSPPHSEVAAAWDEIRTAIVKVDRYDGFIRYAIQQGKTPAQLTRADLVAWGEVLRQRGLRHSSIRQVQSRFPHSVRKAGLIDKFPLFSFAPKKAGYGILFDSLPAGLRAQIKEAIEARQTPNFLEFRPWEERIGSASAENIRGAFCRFAGYVINIEGRGVNSIKELVTRISFVGSINYALQRGNNGRSLSKHQWQLWATVRLYAAMHPEEFKDVDLSWFPSVIKAIPTDSDNEEPEYLKFGKDTAYETLLAMVGKMEATRPQAEKRGKQAVARLLQDILLIVLLLIMPWRQKNLRHLRWEKNLFRREIPPTGKHLPPEVEEKLKLNPNQEFWQVYIPKSEIKPKKREVWLVVPLRLVALVEEYKKYRPALVSGSDSETVFVNATGQPFADRQQFGNYVKNLTWKYAGRATPPQRFRNSITYWYGRNRPWDHITVLQVLGNYNLPVVMNSYASQLNDSFAVYQMEDLRREQESGLPPKKTAETSFTAGAGSPSKGVSADQHEYCRRCGDLTHVSPNGYCSRCLAGLGFARKAA